jgi:catechol 2,3-dioxygenase-like lactoylglutathione lyase family enzyme
MNSEPPTFIHHFSLAAPTDILEEVVAFYDDILDLKPGARPDFGVPGYWLYSGDQPIIHLIEDGAREGKKSGYFDHVALRCADLENVIARLEEKGISFSRLDIEQTSQIQLFLSDPAGTTLELNFQGKQA